MNQDLERYSVIYEKNKREIVLLRGNGCKWLKCRFCNYHLDRCNNEEENYQLNKDVLSQVTGQYQKLEVINSGSFVDLNPQTMNEIIKVCQDKKIKQIHFECHYMHRKEVERIRTLFSGNGILCKVKIGVETFDTLFRECYLVKGITTDNPAEIAKYFDECCLLQGIPGQNRESMIRDIETGLAYFERVCVNIMIENGMPVKPDLKVRSIFLKEVYPIYKNNERVDILLNNTDFGVGGKEHDE